MSKDSECIDENMGMGMGNLNEINLVEEQKDDQISMHFVEIKTQNFDFHKLNKCEHTATCNYLDELISDNSIQGNKKNHQEKVSDFSEAEIYFIRQLKGVYLLKAGKTQEGIDLLNSLSLEIDKNLENPEKYLLNSNIFYLIGYIAKLAKKDKEALGFLLRSQQWRIWLIGNCLVKRGLLTSIPKVCDENFKKILLSGELKFSPLILDLMQGLALTWKHISSLDERLTPMMQQLSAQFYSFVEKERLNGNPVSNLDKEDKSRINSVLSTETLKIEEDLAMNKQTSINLVDLQFC